MESAQLLKVNFKVAGQPCLRCLRPLEVATDAAVCTGCQGHHHRSCWDGSGGCATPGCVHAPLARIDVAPAPALAPGTIRCPNCRSAIGADHLLCPLCGVVTSPDGIYHGPKTNAPGAVASLVYGLIGLFICGVLCGPVAISKANAARRAIAANPTYGGGGLAMAGLVLGIVDLIAFAVLMMIRMGAQS